jgi:endonuclease/exonuclease/phosphatase family metal-dependent hydrolase
MFYRTETLKLIDSGDVQYENNNTDNDAYRSYAWGYFEQISTGKKFIATSTHLSPDDSSLRRGSAKQLSDELEKMSTEYGAPAIMLGDYNSRVSADAYGTMKIKFHSARDKAQTRVNMSISTFLGDINQPIMSGTSVLDHCFYSKKGLTATHFETVASKYASVYTDHLAIICDFIID